MQHEAYIRLVDGRRNQSVDGTRAGKCLFEGRCVGRVRHNGFGTFLGEPFQALRVSANHPHFLSGSEQLLSGDASSMSRGS